VRGGDERGGRARGGLVAADDSSAEGGGRREGEDRTVAAGARRGHMRCVGIRGIGGERRRWLSGGTAEPDADARRGSNRGVRDWAHPRCRWHDGADRQSKAR
jgi:hypothetical protein